MAPDILSKLPAAPSKRDLRHNAGGQVRFAPTSCGVSARFSSSSAYNEKNTKNMERLLGWIYKGFYRFSKGYLKGADTEPQRKERAAHPLVLLVKTDADTIIKDVANRSGWIPHILKTSALHNVVPK